MADRFFVAVELVAERGGHFVVLRASGLGPSGLAPENPAPPKR
jgi:hypothetical protein